MLRHGSSEGPDWPKVFVNRYQIIIYWSNEDELFIAEVPEL